MKKQCLFIPFSLQACLLLLCFSEVKSQAYQNNFNHLVKQVQQQIFAGDTATVSGEKITAFLVSTRGDVEIRTAASVEHPDRFSLLHLATNLVPGNTHGFYTQGHAVIIHTSLSTVIKDDGNNQEVVSLLEIKLNNSESAKALETGLQLLQNLCKKNTK